MESVDTDESDESVHESHQIWQGSGRAAIAHRASCHRCGNMRKRRWLCVRCPHIYCTKCEVKMIEEFGEDIFTDGCPVCKELCCCGKNRSFSCPRKHHCYKKCPSTKRHLYKTILGFEHASKRCIKSSDAFKRSIHSRALQPVLTRKTSTAATDASTLAQSKTVQSLTPETNAEGPVRRSARLKNKGLGSLAHPNADTYECMEVADEDTDTDIGSAGSADLNEEYTQSKKRPDVCVEDSDAHAHKRPRPACTERHTCTQTETTSPLEESVHDMGLAEQLESLDENQKEEWISTLSLDFELEQCFRFDAPGMYSSGVEACFYDQMAKMPVPVITQDVIREFSFDGAF